MMQEDSKMLIKCPVCDVQLSEEDVHTQVAHMNEMIARGDKAHADLIKERTRGLPR